MPRSRSSPMRRSRSSRPASRRRVARPGVRRERIPGTGPLDPGAFVLGTGPTPMNPGTVTPGPGSNATTVVIIPGNGSGAVGPTPTPGTGSGVSGGPQDPYGGGDDPKPAGSAEDFAREGQQQLSGGDATAAAVSFKKALELDPNNATATIGMGDIAESARRLRCRDRAPLEGSEARAEERVRVHVARRGVSAKRQRQGRRGELQEGAAARSEQRACSRRLQRGVSESPAAHRRRGVASPSGSDAGPGSASASNAVLVNEPQHSSSRTWEEIGQ